MMNKSIICITFLLSAIGSLSINAQRLDSLTYSPRHTASLHQDTHSAVYVAVPLLAGSFAIQGMDKSFRATRNGLMPDFKTSYDNYAQWAPLAVMLGMKVGGIKSRNSWGQLLVADALSGAIMATLVNSAKYTIKRRRPDGTSRNSFPSGHSATAFMTAAFLSKEYGHISPWITVGSYTCATVTGIARVCNNRHWMSDIFAGAGIGILSTELGYFIADKIFKTDKKAINHMPSTINYTPSYIALQLGGDIPFSRKVSENIRLKPGTSVAIDGAYFLTENIGVGANLSTCNYMLNAANIASDADQASTSWTLTAGANLSYPVSSRFLIGGKVHTGYSNTLKDEENNLSEAKSIIYSVGLSTTYRAYEKLNFSLYCDYKHLPASGSVTQSALNSINIGLAAQISLSQSTEQ